MVDNQDSLFLKFIQKLLIYGKIHFDFLFDYVLGHHFLDVVFDGLQLLHLVVSENQIDFHPAQGKFDIFNFTNIAKLFHVFMDVLLEKRLYIFWVSDIIFNLFRKIYENFNFDVVQGYFIKFTLKFINDVSNWREETTKVNGLKIFICVVAWFRWYFMSSNFIEQAFLLPFWWFESFEHLCF